MYPKTKAIRLERRTAAEERNKRYQALTLDQKIEEQKKVRTVESTVSGRQLLKLLDKKDRFEAEKLAAKPPVSKKKAKED